MLIKFDCDQIFQALKDGLIVTDRNLNILYINKAFSIMSEYSEEELIGKRCYDLFPGPLCHNDKCPMNQIANGVEQLSSDSNDHCKRFNHIFCIVKVSAFRDEEGAPAGIVETFTDYSLLKWTQQELFESRERLRKSMGGIIQAMSLTIEKRDPYTAGHQRRVAKLCRAIGSELALDWERIQGLRMAAVIHDLGKIHVPAAILNKPGKLSAHEMGIIRQHPQTAYEILKGIDFPWPLAEAIYQHHERLDGSGYPRGLKGDQIILEARILAVADVVESMSSFRPYRKEIGIEKAIIELKSKSGILYDSEVTKVCLELLTKHGFNFNIKFKKHRSLPPEISGGSSRI
jgi:PAS domain S-box-containing protein